ncbi:MAG: T9SS type A sorting domain-containing protein [Chitinophagales bacterium]
MKQLFTLFSAVLISLQVFSQIPNLQWANLTDTMGNMKPYAVTTDAAGNVYTAGVFAVAVGYNFDFDPGPDTLYLTGSGDDDVYVQKFAPNGQLLWAKAFGGIYIEQANDIEVDTSGNVYVAGTFQQTVDFNPGAAVNSISCVGVYNSYVLKLDANGNYVWAKSIQSGYALAYCLAVDKAGNVYSGGYVDGSGNFDPNGTNLNLTGGRIYIQKLSANGGFLWAKLITGGGGDDAAYALELDTANNVLVAGLFAGTCDFNPGAGVDNKTSAGLTDAFLLKLDAAGNYLDTKIFGGTSQEVCNSIDVDASGNILLAGYYSSTTDFNPGAGVANLTPVAGGDIYVLKLDAQGNYLWAKSMGGPGGEYAAAIATDLNGNIYTTGQFYQGTVDFDPGAATFNITPTQEETFVLKLDASGNFSWATSLNCIGIDRGTAIDVDAWGNIYTAGYFGNVADFDPTGGTLSVNAVGFRGYLWKLGPPCALATSFNPSAGTVCAGSSLNFTNTSSSALSYTWSLNGQFVSNSSGSVSIPFPASGNATVKLRIQAGACADSATATITVNPKPSVSFNTSNATCGAANGGITTTVSGGSSYSYLWSTGAVSSGLTNMPGGNYTITVTNNFNCSATGAGFINSSGAPAVTANSSNALCNGQSSGSLSVSVTGGTPNYSYLWSTNAATASVSNVPAGVYTITVTDAQNCQATASATVSEPAALSVGITSNNTISCFNGADGALSSSVQGGTGSYTYNWSNSSTANTVTGLNAGTYCVTVSDANTCTATSCIQLSNPVQLTALVTVDSNVTCNGLLNGKVSVAASGGTGNLNYLWSNLNTASYLSGVAAGTYSITITDSEACTVSALATVTEPAIMQAVITCLPTSSSQANGSASLIVTGGTIPYNYSWSNGGNTSAVSGLTAGNISVTASDANGCLVTAQCAVQVSSGLDETNANIRLLNIWPNPAQGIVWVELTLYSTAEVKLVLLDMFGSEVSAWYKSGLTAIQQQIDTREIASGIYVIHIETERGTVSRRIVIN